MDEAIYANQTSRVNGAYDYIVYCDLLDHELVFASGILWKFQEKANELKETAKKLAEEKKEKIRELLLEHGIDLEALKADQNMTDVDDFDFICHVCLLYTSDAADEL